MLFNRIKNKKMRKKIWTFVIRKKSIRQIWEKILDTTTKTGLDAVKTASKKVDHKIAEVLGKFRGSKISKKIVKPKPMFDINSKII